MNALYLLLYAGARKRLLYAVSKPERQRAQGYAERCARLGEEAAKRKGEKKKKKSAESAGSIYTLWRIKQENSMIKRELELVHHSVITNNICFSFFDKQSSSTAFIPILFVIDVNIYHTPFIKFSDIRKNAMSNNDARNFIAF